jgi:hypothetical protein
VSGSLDSVEFLDAFSARIPDGAYAGLLRAAPGLILPASFTRFWLTQFPPACCLLWQQMVALILMLQERQHPMVTILDVSVADIEHNLQPLTWPQVRRQLKLMQDGPAAAFFPAVRHAASGRHHWTVSLTVPLHPDDTVGPEARIVRAAPSSLPPAPTELDFEALSRRSGDFGQYEAEILAPLLGRDGWRGDAWRAAFEALGWRRAVDVAFRASRRMADLQNPAGYLREALIQEAGMGSKPTPPAPPAARTDRAVRAPVPASPRETASGTVTRHTLLRSWTTDLQASPTPRLARQARDFATERLLAGPADDEARQILIEIQEMADQVLNAAAAPPE